MKTLEQEALENKQFQEAMQIYLRDTTECNCATSPPTPPIQQEDNMYDVPEDVVQLPLREALHPPITFLRKDVPFTLKVKQCLLRLMLI